MFSTSNYSKQKGPAMANHRETLESGDLVDLARAIGHAAGGNVYFGVRPHNDSLFAGCNDVECDGSTFRSALMGVLNQLASKSRRDAISAKQVVERAESLSRVQSDYSEGASE